jgi:1-acyl-sn-glycerol-3-phosphate acyltransferase
MSRPPRPSRLYFVLATLSWPVLKIVFRHRALGIENVPRSDGFVLAANHSSNFDPWPLGVPIFPRRFLRFMAKSELFWFPLGKALAAGGAFRVRRGERDEDAARLGALRVRYGPPVELGDLDGLPLPESAQFATDRLRSAIAELEELLA